MKKVLIIGAGFLQSFVIKKAKEMGLYVLALDADSHAPGFVYADKYDVINIVDQEACLAYAQENHIDGVLTAATEYGVLTAAYIAQEMDLPGLDFAAARRVRDRYLVRKCFIENRVDDSDGQVYEVGTAEEAEHLAHDLTYPVMVKPSDGSGSRATSRVDRPEDLSSACTLAMVSSAAHRAVVEPFVVGEEYGAESLVVDGDIHVLAIMKKKMTEPPYYAELGHAIPCELPADLEAKAKKYVKRAIGALGINHGAVNVDMLITDDGDVHIVDVGARMGGNMIGPCIVPYGQGIDYMAALVHNAMGEEVDLSAGPCSAVATRLLAFHEGVIGELPDFERLQKEYGVEIYHHMHAGDIAHEYRTNLDGCGYVVAKAATGKEAARKAAAAFDRIASCVSDGGRA